MEHGIGRYEGLTSVMVGKAPHDCVALTYAGGDKLYVPVENIDVLSRYGGAGDGATLDRLGGEAWQRRKSRMKERIREIAGELIKTAAIRATRARPGRRGRRSLPEFVDRFPYEETDDQDRAIAEVLEDLESGKPMDRLVCGDVGFGKTEVALRAAFVAAMAGLPGRADLPDHPARPPALFEFRRAASRASRSRSAGCRGWFRRPKPRRPGRASKRARSTSSSAPTRCCRNRSNSRSWAWSLSTRSSISGSPTRRS